MTRYEHELETRDSLIKYFTRYLGMRLTKTNPAFRFIRIETPILLALNIERTTQRLIKIHLDDQTLVLRNNTQSGALEASHDILNGKMGVKQKLPVVIWQHGKIFHREKTLLQESYSLEFQILFSPSTAAPYRPIILSACETMLKKQCGPIFLGDYDETDPDTDTIYSEGTTSPLITIRDNNNFWAGRNIEVVAHMDNCTRASIQSEA